MLLAVTSTTAEAILIRVGVEPNTKLLRGKLDLDENGYVKINQNCETNIKRIFAVGDAANPLAPTVSSAVGMGATAAKVIFALLKS
jgi:thioredoxin reductase